MTLPDDEVMAFLDEHFVLGNENIKKEEHVGMSHGYSAKQSAVGTTNGAGGRNVQFVVMAPDETVLLVLPGFWHKEDLLPELRLALEIDKLHRTEQVSQRRKLEMFEFLHRRHLRRNGPAAETRGSWQDFDERAERERRLADEQAGLPPRDVFVRAHDGTVTDRIKPIPQLVHERLLAHPFEKYDDFDMETFVDYGRPFYDNNWGDRGRDFDDAERANRKRERERERARKKELRELAKQARLARAAD